MERKLTQVGIFLGKDTFTPVKYQHLGAGTGKILWSYMRPFSRERTLENINTLALGNKYDLFINDKRYPTKVQIFYMDVTGNLTPGFIPPVVFSQISYLINENQDLKTLVSDFRKALFDKSHKDRLMKEAIRLGGFRKEFIEAGMTGAEQYSGYSGYPLSRGIFGLPPTSRL